MNTDELIKTHNELMEKLKFVLSDFMQEHMSEKTNTDELYLIIQSVLCKAISEVEYRIGQPAPFTRHQIDHICYQIGDWYLMMKPLLEGEHNLGFMKEKLKIMICGDD